MRTCSDSLVAECMAGTTKEMAGQSRPRLSPQVHSLVPPNGISRPRQLFQMRVEPRDDPIAEVYLVGIAPIRRRVTFSFVSCIFHLFSQSAQIYKHFITQIGSNRNVVRPVNNQQRSLDSIEKEDGRISDIPIANIPGRPAHRPLPLLLDRYPKCRSISSHSSIAADKISHSACI